MRNDQDDHYACHPNECDVAAAERADAEMQSALADAICTGRVAAAESILQMSHELGDEGWNAIADQAAEAGYDRSVVLRRRRPEGNFTAMTIEAAYQYGYRRAAEVARGVTRPYEQASSSPALRDPQDWTAEEFTAMFGAPNMTAAAFFDLVEALGYEVMLVPQDLPGPAAGEPDA